MKLETALIKLGYKKLCNDDTIIGKRFAKGDYTESDIKAWLDPTEDLWSGTMGQVPTKNEYQTLFVETLDGGIKREFNYSRYDIEELLSELLEVSDEAN